MGDLTFDDPKREWFTVKEAVKRVRVGADCYYWYSLEGPKKDLTSCFEHGWRAIPDSRGLMVSPVSASGLKPQRKRKPKHVVANDIEVAVEYSADLMSYVVALKSHSASRTMQLTVPGGAYLPIGPNIFMAFEE